MNEKCGCEYSRAEGIDDEDCAFPEALAHLKALILAQAFRSEVSDAASDFVKEHE